MRLSGVELDRAAGALVGAAAGDALGAGYEFARDVPAGPGMIGGGLGGWEPGEWTDDTQLSICVAEEAAGGPLDAVAVGERFLDWLRSGPADVGNQTRAVLTAAATGGDLRALAAAYHGRHPGAAAGNGSLMRTAPVALASLGDDTATAAAARAVSELTHADPLAGDACVLWSIAIDRAVRFGRLDGVRDGLDLLPAGRRGTWAQRLDEAEKEPPGTFRPNGFVVTALQAAHAAITQTPVPEDEPCRHLERALATAVRVGDDTDTVAAIAGAVLGARWGASGVPSGWKAMLHGWPRHRGRRYRSADLARLAVLATRSGSTDDTGWPRAHTLLPYYRRELQPPGLRIPLPGDHGVTAGDVAALAAVSAHDTDTIVSLCRIGRDDIPDAVDSCQLWVMDELTPEANPNLDFLLRDLARQIGRWRDAGKRVLVHGARAENHTSTVAAAYLAERFGLSGTEALRRVTEVVPGACPNPGFVHALRRLWPGD